MTALEFQKYERRRRRRTVAPELPWTQSPDRRVAGGPPRRLSVVVPCRGQAQTLRTALSALGSALGASGLNWETIVVDCACADESRSVIDTWRIRPGFRAIAVEPGLFGVGAVARGLAEARGDVAIVFRAGIPQSPRLIRELVASWRADSLLAYIWRDATTGEDNMLSWTRGMFDEFRSQPGRQLPTEATSLCLFDRQVIEHLVRGDLAAQSLRDLEAN